MAHLLIDIAKPNGILSVSTFKLNREISPSFYLPCQSFGALKHHIKPGWVTFTRPLGACTQMPQGQHEEVHSGIKNRALAKRVYPLDKAACHPIPNSLDRTMSP
jgi:hypothetical protein